MAIPFGRHDALGPQQEDETLEQRGIGCEADGLETFEGVLIRAFVIQARLAHGGDDDPVAGQIDGVAVALVHGRHGAPSERPVQRILGAFAFQGNGGTDTVFMAGSTTGTNNATFYSNGTGQLVNTANGDALETA